MSIVVRYAPVPASTVEQYEEVMRHLQESGEMPADGFDYHVAFLFGWSAARERNVGFAGPVGGVRQARHPLLADVSLEHSGQPEIFDVHNIIRR